MFFSRPLDKKLVLAEIALIIASVFIFRGMWTLLDRAAFMHEAWALWVSVVLGVVVSVLALRYILKD